MNRPLFEGVLQSTISPDALSTGEEVIVVTQMGNEVCRGVVTQIYSYGAVQIRTSDIPDTVPPGGFQSNGDRIYNTRLYRFVLVEPEVEIEVEEAADSLSEEPEEKLEESLKQMKETLLTQHIENCMLMIIEQKWKSICAI